MPFHHASAQEWEIFVQHFATSKKCQEQLLLYRRQFIVWYLDLEEWFAAPLVERVGRSDEECRQNVGHNDVQYINHLLPCASLSGLPCFTWVCPL